MKRPQLTLVIGAVLAGTMTSAGAAGLDGGAPITCATSVTFDCAVNGECIQDSPEAVNLPRLIRLDFAAKKAFTKSAAGEDRTSDIGSQQVEEDRLILQGVQNSNAWSLAVSRKTGVMSLSISGDEAAIVAFGICEAF